MGIIEKLNNMGIEIVKSNNFYYGYYNTERGIVATRDKKLAEKGVYFLQTTDKKTFPCTSGRVYILSGTPYEGITDKNKIEELARNGEIYSFVSEELYSEYYDFKNDKQLECCFKYYYSLQSREYIEKTMKDIGLIKYSVEYDGNEEFKILEFAQSYETQIYGYNTEIAKIKDSWIVQTPFMVGIDGIGVIKMFFNHEPSEKDLFSAFAIKKFEENPMEEFICCECGRRTNWLEIKGDIINKVSLLKDSYCGCHD